jgi:general stress protein YciG
MSTYKPTEHDGLKQDGTEDKRVGTHEFAQGKVDPHEAGRKGGQSSGGNTDDTDSPSTDNRGSKKGGKFPVHLAFE